MSIEARSSDPDSESGNQNLRFNNQTTVSRPWKSDGWECDVGFNSLTDDTRKQQVGVGGEPLCRVAGLLESRDSTARPGETRVLTIWGFCRAAVTNKATVTRVNQAQLKPLWNL